MARTTMRFARKKGASVNRNSRCVHLLALVIATLLGAGTAGAETADRPDFNGFWMPNVGQSLRWPYNDPPFTEYGQAVWDAYAAEFDTAVDDPSRLCVPESMPRSMIEPPFPVEIIQRDHDITMFFEAWSMYRKIHMADHDHSPAVLHTRMGYSVAHWEGDTLVIETTHLRERTMGKIMMSDDARIEERVRLEVDDDGRKRLINDIAFFDEQVYTAPVTMRGVWDYSPDSPVLEYICTEEIWDQYLETLRDQGVRVF
jgi:hypothetical protein